MKSLEHTISKEDTTSNEDLKNNSLFFKNSLWLYLVLILGFMIRFYHLETPGMWWDEILVAITSKYPTNYIFEWASSVEVHSPYFHLFVKLITQMGESDFVLKFFPALFGVLSIFLIYKFANEYFSWPCGLVACTIFAFNPIHVIMSRQLRPYSIVVFFFLLSSICLLRYLKKGTLSSALLFCLANLIGLSCHYMTFLVIASQCAFCFFMYISGYINLKKTLRIFTLMFISVLPVLYFVSTVFKLKMGIVNSDVSALEALHNAVKFYLQLFYIYDLTDPFERKEIFISIAILAGGFFVVFRHNKTLAFYLLSVLVVPLCALSVAKNTFNAARYLLFVLPVFCICFGSLFIYLSRYKSFVLLLVTVYSLVNSLNYLSFKQELFYSSDAHSIFGPAGKSKANAQILSQKIGPGEITYFGNDSFDSTLFDEKNSIIWYYSQFVDKNFLAEPKVTRDEQLMLNIVSRNKDSQAYLDRLAPNSLLKCDDLYSNFNYCRYFIPRDPFIDISHLPFVLDMDNSISMISNSQEFENFAPLSLTRPALIPTENHAGGRMVNHARGSKLSHNKTNFIIDVYYTLSNPGSVYKLTAKKTDGISGNATSLYECEYDPRGSTRHLRLMSKNINFSGLLELEHRLQCSLKKPLYAGDNLSNAQINRVVVKAIEDEKVSSELDLFADYLSYDFLRENYFKPIFSSGFSEIEYDQQRNKYFRWVDGDYSKVSYIADKPLPGLLVFKIINSQIGNRVQVKINEETVLDSTDSFIEGDIIFFEKSGENIIEFFSDNYNHKEGQVPFAPHDQRALSINFEDLIINRNIGTKLVEF